jgi:hypothetical protein
MFSYRRWRLNTRGRGHREPILSVQLGPTVSSVRAAVDVAPMWDLACRGGFVVPSSMHTSPPATGRLNTPRDESSYKFLGTAASLKFTAEPPDAMSCHDL